MGPRASMGSGHPQHRTIGQSKPHAAPEPSHPREQDRDSSKALKRDDCGAVGMRGAETPRGASGYARTGGGEPALLLRTVTVSRKGSERGSGGSVPAPRSLPGPGGALEPYAVSPCPQVSPPCRGQAPLLGGRRS